MKEENDIDIGIASGDDAVADSISVEVDTFDNEVTQDTEGGIEDDKLKYGTYPADCYSFMSIHGPFDKNGYFYFGFAVWAFQVSFLFILVLHVIHPKLTTNENDDNPEQGFWAKFIPANSGDLSKATQFIALISYCTFADESLKDIVTAVETFPKFSRAKPGDKVYLMVLSCALRLLQGLLATIVVFLLVIVTSDVIDIILNFTAVNFISGFDDVAFELAQWGKYGPSLKKEADRIEVLPAPACIFRKYQHVRYRFTVVPIGLALLTGLIIIMSTQNSREKWLTTKLRVQFKDDPLRNGYNGCYKDVFRKNKRVLFESYDANSDPAKFGYCDDNGKKKWYLFTGNATAACDAADSEAVVAYSSKTYTYDFSSITEETWYSRTGTPLELYFFDDNKNDLTDEECNSFLGDGLCDGIFNIFDHNYDEGDCCAATCNDRNCGTGTLTEAFNNNITTGNGYPNCINPQMKPITIKLNNIYETVKPNFGAPETPTPFDNLPPRNPLMILDCDEKNTFMVKLKGDMKFETETVWVADGADCKMTVTNSTGGPVDMQYVNYTVYHGDKESIENDPIVMFQEDSFVNGIHSFQRIPECFFTKLKNYTDIRTIYTGNGSSNKAIKWLMEDSRGYSNCEYDTFLERYALATMNYAAPNIDAEESSTELWINLERQCVWRSVRCVDGMVVELDMGASSGLVLSGTIPTEIGLLRNLEWLDLGFNSISGTIPSEIGEWQNLTFFGLDSNTVTGAIPTEIGAMTNLAFLIMNNNMINGTIPTEIGEMKSLRGFVVYLNDLVGPIPNEIGGASSLEYLITGGNTLTGTIPSVLGTLPNLTHIESIGNALIGTIPSELGLLQNLKYLELEQNLLTGSVPTELLYKNVSQLWVFGNALSNLTPVDGEEICFAGGGEVYCDCSLDCTSKPQQCSCEEGSSCCSSYLQQYTACAVCSSGLKNPGKFIEEFAADCVRISEHFENSRGEYGTEDACTGAKIFFEKIGCLCNEDPSSLFVESEECGPELVLCADAGPCFDHMVGCTEDGSVVIEECDDALPACKPCFPFSRCGGDEATVTVGSVGI